LPAESAPALRIRSAFAGPIWRVDVDADQRHAAIAGDYKAVAVWDLTSGKSAPIWRLPLRDEQRKRAHAVAISPDGTLLAYAVPPRVDRTGKLLPSTSAIYVLRRATGEILRTLTGSDHDIVSRPQAIRFSPSGEHLVAVLSSACGVRMWSTANWKLVGKDDIGFGRNAGADECCRSLELEVCDLLPDGNSVHFSASAPGYYLLVSGDAGIKAYRSDDGSLVRVRSITPAAVDLDRPAGIAESPDGKFFLVGDRRNRNQDGEIALRVAVLQAETLAPARAPLRVTGEMLLSAAFLEKRSELSDVNQSSLDRVAWLKSPSGPHIFAGGVFPCEIASPERLVRTASAGEICILRWDPQNLDQGPVFIPFGTDRIADLIGLPHRGELLVASQRTIAVVDQHGDLVGDSSGGTLSLQNGAADMRSSLRRFAISADAKSVTVQDYLVDSSYLTFSLRDSRPQVAMSQTPPAGMVEPDQDENIVEGWRNVSGNPPSLLGIHLSGPEYHKDETYRAVSLLQNQRLAVLGSSEALRVLRYRPDGITLLCKQPLSEDAYRVVISPDGRLIVSGHSDGTVRWHRVRFQDDLCSIELVLSVYLVEVRPGKWGWVAWRPDGKFAQDAEAKSLLEWQVDDGTGGVRITPFARLLEWYDERSIGSALDSEDSSGAQQPNPDVLKAHAIRTASLQILPYPPTHSADNEKVRFRLQLTASGKWPKKLSARTGSGHAIEIDINGIHHSSADPATIEQPGTIEPIITLPGAARTRNAQFDVCFYLDEQDRTCQSVKWEGPTLPRQRPRLWAIFVGISKYDTASLNLRFAQNDALDLARLFASDFERTIRTGPREYDYRSVDIQLVLSPLTASAENAATALANHHRVTLRPGTKEGLTQALNKVVEVAQREELNGDLFLLHFSGHGVLHPDPSATGRTVFATQHTGTSGSLTDNLAMTGFSSAELITFLRKIPGQKLIVIDACRSFRVDQHVDPIDPELAALEFRNGDLSANFFFGSLSGQGSSEFADVAFDKARPARERGNGLFTAAFLRALTTRTAAREGVVTISDAASFMQQVFFNSRDPKSPAARVRQKYRLPFIQEPKYYRGRDDEEPRVIRTVE